MSEIETIFKNLEANEGKFKESAIPKIKKFIEILLGYGYDQEEILRVSSSKFASTINWIKEYEEKKKARGYDEIGKRLE